MKWRSHQLLEVFAVTALWLCAYLTYSLHMWYPHDTWGEDVLCTISRSRSHGSIKVLAVSSTWLHPFLTYSLHMWYTHPMRWQCVAHHFRVQRSRSHGSIKVFAVSLCGSVPSGPIHYKCGTHTTHEVTICRAPFLGQKVKGQGHTGRLKFLQCPFHVSVPFRPVHFICGTHTTHKVMMCCTPFLDQKVKGQGHMGCSKFLPAHVRSMAPSLFNHTGHSYVNCWPSVAKGCRS